MILLDTNTCIYVMKNKYTSLTEKLLRHDPEQIAVSAITLHELEYGAAKSRWGERTRDKMHAFLAPFTILPFNATDAIAAGNIRAFLVSEGTPIGPYDLMIAAQAVVRGMTVVTHNTKEFMRVPDLKLEDWVVIS